MTNKNSIVYLKSWLSINSSIGCDRNCKYCNKNFYNISDIIEKIVNPKELVQNLLADWRFLKNKTPISINSRGTDPFHNKVRNETIEILELLEEKGIKNICGIITKNHISKDVAAKLASFKNLKIIVFYSFSMLPKNIEPGNNERKIQSLLNMKVVGVPSVLYFRPIIRGVNDDENSVKNALMIANTHCQAIARSAIRLDKKNLRKMNDIDFSINEKTLEEIGSKVLDIESRKKIETLYAKLGINIPLFKKTSCSVSYLLNIPDYNAHWFDENKFCSIFCPEIQKNICKKRNENYDELIAIASERIKKQIIIKNNEIFTSENISFEEKMFLKHIFSLPINIKSNYDNKKN